MNTKKLEKIKAEIQTAEDYLLAADILYKNNLYCPSASASYNCAYHTSLAALLTSGEKVSKEAFARSLETLGRFSRKLDPAIETARESAKGLGVVSSQTHSENEALLRLYQTREFVTEVKGFMKKIIK